jgi:hypothetical protein
MAGEFTMLNLPQEESNPTFGNSIMDIFEENVTVNKLNAGIEPLYTEDEKDLVRYGLRTATECLTHDSPFLRNDMFR